MKFDNSNIPLRRTSRWRMALLGAAASLFMAPAVNAQVNAYSFVQTSGTYAPLVGGTILAAPTGNASATSVDDAVFPITGFPFSFSYNGVGYTSCFISSNGFISFGATAPSTTNYTAISSTGSAGIVAAWAGDLNGMFQLGGITSDMRWDVVGTAPSREIVIQWTDWRPSYSTSTTSAYRINMQIRLHETTNKVSIIYGTNAIVIGTGTFTGTRQIGLRGAAPTDYNNRLNLATTLFTASTAGTANSSSQAWNTTGTPPPGMPSAGQTYTWTAPSCVAPGGLLVSGTTTTSANVSWNAAVPTPTGYQWAVTTSAIPPASGTATAGLSASAAGLAPNTTHYLHVRSDCGSGVFSGWVTTSFYTGYCTASGTSVDTQINNVLMTGVTTLNNTSAGNAGYGNFTAVTPTVSQAAGLAVPFTLTYTADPGTAIFIDWNNDLVFANPGERVFVNGYLTGSVSGSFTVPAAQPVGNYRMRIVADYFSSTPVQCPSGIDGETEDYIFTVLAPPACAAPSATSITGIGNTGATVNWTCASCTGSFIVDYGVAPYNTPGVGATAGAGGNVVSSAVPSASLAGLLVANTTYDVYVRQVCSGPSYSTNSVKITFTTLCDPIGVPFSQNFNAVTAPAIPSCWSVQDVNGGTSWNTAANTANGFTGNCARYTYNTTLPGNDWIYSPGLTLTGGTSYQVAYKYAAQSSAYPEAMDVFYGSSPVAGSMTNLIVDHGSFSFIAASSVTYNFIPATSGTYYIGWHAKSAPDEFYLNLDDISVTLTPSCISPTAPMASATSGTEGAFSWGPAASGDPSVTYTWVVVASGAGPNGTPVDGGTITGTSASSTILTPTTAYDFYVTNNCAGSSSSAAGPVAFVTPCITYIPDYVQTFATVPPACWSVNTVAGFNGWGLSTNYDGGGAAKFNLYNAGDDVYLISPSIDLSAGGYELALNVALTDYFGSGPDADGMEADDAVQILYSETGGAPWTTIATYNAGNQPTNTGRVDYYPLVSTGASVVFAIRAFEGADLGPNDYDFHVADFKVRTPPTCGATAAPANEDCVAGTYDIVITDVSVTGPATVQYKLNNGAVQSVPFTSPTTTITGLNVAQAANITLVTDAGCTNQIGNVQSACAVELDCAATSPLPFQHCYSNGDTRKWYFHTPEVGGKIDLKFLLGSTLGAGDNVIFWNGVPGASTQIGSYSGNMSNLTFTGQANQYLGVSITTNGTGSCADGLAGSVWNFTVRCSGCTEPAGLVLLPPDNGEVVDCTAGTFEASVYVESFGINGTGPNAGFAPATTTISWTAGGVAQPNIVLTQTSDESGLLTSLGSWPVGVEINVTLLHGNGETVCNNIIGTGLTIPYSACPPANDDCATAELLTVGAPGSCPASQVIGTTLGAGQSGSDPSCATGPIQDVWYEVNTVGFAEPTLTITAISAGAIGLEAFTACGTPYVTACLIVPGPLNFNLPPATYFLRVWTTAAQAGTFSICLEGEAPAVNDEPCTATPLTLGVGNCAMTSSTTLNATNSTGGSIGDPACSNYFGGDVWFTVVVGASGIVTIDSDDAEITDSGMSVYTSDLDCTGNFTEVACDDDGSVNGPNGYMSRIVLTGRTPGELLYIRFFEYGNDAPGTFSICASEPPLNDNCAGAISLDPSTLACTGANGATGTATQSFGGCSGTANDDVWYSFLATETSHLIRVSGSGAFDAVFELFDGGSNPGVCPIAGPGLVCQDLTGAGGLEEFTAVGLSIGNTYFVRVYDFGTEFLLDAVSFNICVTKVPTCLAPTATAATGITTGTAFANWTPNAGGSGSNFIVEYGLASNFTTPGTGLTAGTNGTVILNAVSPRSLGALAANTQYRYFVRQNCSATAEGFSFNSNGIVFTTLALPPANDECAGAVTLSGTNTTCVNTAGTVAGATQSPSQAGCVGTANDDVWYKFVAAGENYSITVVGADLVHQLFSGTCGALTSVACSDPQVMTVTGLTIGATYYVRVYGYYSGVASPTAFNICVVKNSDCLPPATITTTNITSSSADIAVDGSPTANYILEYGLSSNFTTPGTGATAAANGTVIAFTGNLQQISGLALTTNYRYFVRRDCGTGIYSANSTARTFLTLGAPPANDLCANAVTVTCGGTFTGTNVNATTDSAPVAVTTGQQIMTNGVWYKFVGNNQSVTLSTCNSSFDTRIHVYTGTCASPVVIAGNEDDDDGCTIFTSKVTFNAILGTTYLIAIDGYGSYSTGSISLNVTCGALCLAASNDDCANAEVLTVSPIGFCNSVTGTTACALPGVGIPNPSCASSPFDSYPDVYYTFTAAGTSHPIQVNELTGTLEFWSLNELSCGGQEDFCSYTFGSLVSVTGLTSGAVYSLRIGSVGDATFDVCIGAPTCSQDVTVEWQLGATGAIPAWEMRQVGTNVVVASGGGFNAGAPFAVYPETACLPEGKFYFDMLSNLDAGGGYKVRLGQAPFTRLIDNTVAVGSNSITELTAVPAALGSNGPLQIPVGPNELLYSSCDKYFWAAGEYIVVNEDPQVAATWLVGQADAAQSSTSGYDFWFYNPDGGYSYIRQRRNNVSDNFGSVGSARTCHMKVNNWAAANHIPNGAQLNVRVRAVVNNVPKNWGPACRFVRDEALAACTPTKLFDIPGHFAYSCNVFRAFNTATANRLYARPVGGATKYRFHIYNGETDITLERTVYYLTLGWTASVATVLQDEAVYDVTVQAFVGGVWCPVGEVCTVQICNTPASCTNDIAGGQQNSVLDNEAAFLMWPNPNNGALLNVNLSGVEEGTNTVSMDVFDLSGKRIIARTLAVQGGFVSQVVDLNGEISTGMYMVRVTAGDQVYSERLVIQK